MTKVDIFELGADVAITLRKSELREFANTILEGAIDRVRADIGLQPTEVYYTVKQVAQLLSVDRTTLYYWNKRGYLPALKFGGVVRYRKSDVEALTESREA